MKYIVPKEYEHINIENVEFKYIFTVDLKGRIVNLFKDTTEEKEDSLFEEEKSIDLKKEIEHIYTTKMKDSFVQYYVEKYFLEHATPIRWILSPSLQNKILKNALKLFDNKTCSECKSQKNCFEYSKFKNILSLNIKEKDLFLVNIGGDEYNHLIAGIEIKLFSQGSMSILIRFKYKKPLSVSDCVNYSCYANFI